MGKAIGKKLNCNTATTDNAVHINNFKAHCLKRSVDMDIASITSNTAMAAMVRQLQTVNELQTAVMRQLADSQQELAAMLAEMGIGQNIDTLA